MTLYKTTIIWEKGEHGYRRGIKGRNNYRHHDGDNFFNGHGGARMNTNMALTLIGFDSSGIRREFDIRHYLLEALGRKNMNQSLLERIIRSLPNEIVIDEASSKISDDSMRKIIQNYNAFEGK